jgi:AraC-like DNA-binding protein
VRWSGFASPTAFRERFRQIVGVSPRDYRRA